MDLLNRYIDRPLLDAASKLLNAWHNVSGLAPSRLEPVWNIAVLLLMLVGSFHALEGQMLALCVGALTLLVAPSILKLWMLSAKPAAYDVREYRARMQRALAKREGEWAMRLTVLVVAAVLPFFSPMKGDVDAAWFMFGASLWFVLTAPISFYLEAAEPPKPRDGDPMFNSKMLFN
ncbi:hypothetical protein [Oryzifoliimicrobium ureilyticus]|uniref:hypothetical protein n=1 Tax=Oryzifoliimicrobium ureilyticus TaxID=3113724 RepID=UPI0030763D2F